MLDAARQRIAELEPEFWAEYRYCKILLARQGQNSPVPPIGTLTIEKIEAWFLARGVRCRAALSPGGGLIYFESAELA